MKDERNVNDAIFLSLGAYFAFMLGCLIFLYGGGFWGVAAYIVVLIIIFLLAG